MKYGRYQVVSEIGRGTMGIVYQAHDPQIDRLVALKVLRQDRLSSQDYVKRFLKEATAVGRLSHRSIVTVYDIGQDHGTIYIAMELLEGTALDELLKQGHIDIDQTLHIAREVAEALHYAHQKGIIHRDIKPANIIRSESGEVKVTDFGIAHIEDPDGQQMTQAGEILGTPVYMSPEQVMGQPVDGRSDLYSLGVILYELTTGRRPFKADNLGALFKAITSDQIVPPQQVNPAIPGWLSDTIEKAMARDPDRRFTSGAELKQTLAGPARQVETEAAGASRKKSSFTPFLLVLALFCSIGAGAYYFQDSITSMVEQLEQRIRPKPEPEPPVEPDVQPGPEPEPEPTPGPVPEPVAEPEPEPGLTPEPPSAPAPEVEPVPEPVLEEKGQTAAEPKPTAEPEPLAKHRPEMKAELQPEAKPIAELKPEVTAVKTEAVPEPKPVEETDPELQDFLDSILTEKPEPEPTAKPVPEPEPASVSTSPTELQVEPRPEPVLEAALTPEPEPKQEVVKAKALLKMRSRPKGAGVYINGEYVGNTPLELEVSQQKHELMLQLEGHGDWKAQVDMSDKEIVPLTVRLLPQ